MIQMGDTNAFTSPFNQRCPAIFQNGIDVLDHLLKNARLFYCTWKYWHASKNHALAIAITVAYDIYQRKICTQEMTNFAQTPLSFLRESEDLNQTEKGMSLGRNCRN
mmetsp:Transcript_22193/g.33554  ORF Transcript_22193/g.33554 Transcript_22193/m.33554 type:complete len:107 (-) Transcript_22193:434-754(-)